MKLLLMWLLGVPALVAFMVMASRLPAHASLASDRQARIGIESCAGAASNVDKPRQICRQTL